MRADHIEKALPDPDHHHVGGTEVLPRAVEQGSHRLGDALILRLDPDDAAKAPHSVIGPLHVAIESVIVLAMKCTAEPSKPVRRIRSLDSRRRIRGPKDAWRGLTLGV